jgi:hypothetical protein
MIAGTYEKSFDLRDAGSRRRGDLARLQLLFPVVQSTPYRFVAPALCRPGVDFMPLIGEENRYVAIRRIWPEGA